MAEAHGFLIRAEEEGGALLFAEDEAALRNGREAEAADDEARIRREGLEAPVLVFHEEGRQLILRALHAGKARPGGAAFHSRPARADPCEAAPVGFGEEVFHGESLFVPPVQGAAGQCFRFAAEDEQFHSSSFFLSSRGSSTPRLTARSWTLFSTWNRWMSSLT